MTSARPLSVPDAPHLLLLDVEPVGAVQEDGLSTQSSLYTGRVFKHNKSEIGNFVTSSAGCLSAVPLVDPDLQNSTKLGEEIAEVLLCTAMRNIPHKQPLIVATLGCASLVTSCPLHLVSC